MSGYLEKRFRTYMVFLDIPKDVREHFSRRPGTSGGRRFGRSLETGDRKKAEVRKAPIVSGWKAQIEAAREGTLDPLEQDIAFWRKALQVASTNEADLEGVSDALVDQADKLEHRKPGEGVRLYKIATGQWTKTDEYIEDWYSSTKGNQKTKDMKRSDVMRFAKAFPMLRDVNRSEVKKWADGLILQDKLSRKTVARVLSALRGYWKYLKAREVVSDETLPFDHLDITNDDRANAKRRDFAPSEVRMFEKAAEERGDDKLADLIRLGMWTGARIDELCSLRVDNVGRESFQVEDAKTNAGWREVPIHTQLKPTLKRLVEDSDDGYVLSGLSMNKYEHRSDAIGKRFGTLKRAHGYDKRYVFHSIRKTVATLLENAGVPENVAADIIGHEKPTMTYGVYSGGSSLKLKCEALERIGYPPASSIPRKK